MKIVSLTKFVFLSLLLTVSTSQAASLNLQTFVAIDVEVREITLNGMDAYLQLLNSGQSTAEQIMADNKLNQVQVSQVYIDNNTTADAHAAYATRHAAQISEWLAANPEWQNHYDWLTEEFESLSTQLNAHHGGN